MKATIYFSLRKDKVKNDLSPIYLRITLNNNHKYLSTKISVPESKWDAPKQRIKGNTDDICLQNRTLDSMRTQIELIQANLRDQNKPITFDSIVDGIDNESANENLVLSAIEKLVQSKKAKKKASGTIKKFGTMKFNLIKYLKSLQKTDIPISAIDYDFVDAFNTYMVTVTKLEIITANKYISLFKQVLHEGIRRKTVKDDSFKEFRATKIKDKKVAVLGAEEINALKIVDLNSKCLDQVRTVFIFQCCTGLAYVDVKNLTASNIVDVNGRKCIKINRQKTGVTCFIPLMQDAIKILDKYKGSYNGKGVLPVIANQNMNKYLKEIQALAEIDVELTTHLARRTAASLWFNNGVPAATIIGWLGHSSFQELNRYVKREAAKDIMEMQDFENKMLQIEYK